MHHWVSGRIYVILGVMNLGRMHPVYVHQKSLAIIASIFNRVESSLSTQKTVKLIIIAIRK
jgi:hypothetical protein